MAASTLEALPDAEALAALKALPPSVSAQLFLRLHESHAARLLPNVSPELLGILSHRVRPEQAAAWLLHLPPELRQRFLEPLTPEVKRQIQELLTYPENSAGRILSTEFVAFHADMKVKDAIQKIRDLASRNVATTYTYVIDATNRLVGVLNTRDLLLAAGDQLLAQVMRTDIFTVSGFTDREDVATQLSQRGYFAAPVVDADQRLLGVVKSDQLLSDVQEEATEDIQKMVGAGGDERPFSPIGFSVRKRLPWLYLNLATAFLAASVVALFEDVIARITVLAVFLPVVAGQGGNAGAQSLAVAIRGLVMREIPPHKVRQLVLKEARLGALHGLLVGVVTSLVAWGWQRNPFLGLVIGLAMLVNLIAAGIAGAAIPITMKALGRDPAQSSSILLTTVTDVVGFFTFLGFATLFQHYLM